MKKREENVLKHKYWNILCKVRDAIKVNVCMVDSAGKMIIPPKKRRLGGSLLMDPAMGFNLQGMNGSKSVRSQFGGKYFELLNRFDLHCLGVPVYLDKEEIGSIIIGPMIMSRKLTSAQCSELAKEHGVDAQDLISEVNDIRIVSNVTASSILDLVNEIAVNNIAMVMEAEGAIQRVPRVGTELAANFKGFLGSILKLAKVESGSVMVLDADKKNLTVKAVEGMDEGIVGQSVKVGKGISGIAAKEKEAFLIESKSSDSRIEHLLKRGDIKRSLVMPLIDDGKILGVLNLHTKNSSDSIASNRESIDYFSELFARTASYNFAI